MVDFSGSQRPRKAASDSVFTGIIGQFCPKAASTQDQQEPSNIGGFAQRPPKILRATPSTDLRINSTTTITSILGFTPSPSPSHFSGFNKNSDLVWNSQNPPSNTSVVLSRDLTFYESLLRLSLPPISPTFPRRIAIVSRFN